MAAVASSAADECSAPTGQLAGRLVVITGASRGVGAELAIVAGGLLERTDASSLTTDEVFGYVAGAKPLRKTTTVEDFAKACVFFAAEASDAVTGQSMSVDGGLTMP